MCASRMNTFAPNTIKLARFFWGGGGGHWYPCFGFLVTSRLGFKSRVGSALFTFCGGDCNVHSPRSTSGATYADLLAAGIATSPVPTYCCRGEVAGIRTRALRISVSLPTELHRDRQNWLVLVFACRNIKY